MTILRLSANATVGGMEMNSKQLWLAFLDTGAPEMYLLYNQAKKKENSHVSDDQGIDSAGYTLQ